MLRIFIQQLSCHRLHQIHAAEARTEWLRMVKKRVQKSSNSGPLGQRPGFLIRRLHQIHVALFQKKCAAFDVTPLQYSLLSALARRGTADQTTLAADVVLDRTTTTGALKRLQSPKFIERATAPRDRRPQISRLTTQASA